VKNCGPIAQKAAAKKLEGLKFQQYSNGNTLTSNIVKNISVSTYSHGYNTTNQTQ